MEEFKNRTTIKSKSYKHSYNISVIHTKGIKCKKEQLELLKKSHFKNTIKISDNLSDEQLKGIVVNNIISVGIFNGDSRTDDSVKETNFIFVDIDNSFTIEQAMEILDKDKLSYMLFTSISHTEENHKFHILIPLLKKITNIEDYKRYYRYINDLFDNKNDKSCSSWSKACFSSPDNCFFVNKLFRNDLLVSAKHLNTYKKMYPNEKAIKEVDNTIFEKYTLNDNYLKQIQNINPNFILESQDEGVIRFKRDENDNYGNVFNKYNNEKHLIDKNKSCDLLFSNNEFNTSKKAEDIRIKIQEDINSEVNEFLITCESLKNSIRYFYPKKVIIANEGVGKSKAIIEACKDYKLIFACYTKDRISEISRSLDEKNIKYNKVISIEDILQSHNISEDIVNEYKKSYVNSYDEKAYTEAEAIEEILIRNKIEKRFIDKICNDIFAQDKLLASDDRVILVTIQKLKFFLKTNMDKNILPIVFDEVQISDFYSYCDTQLSKNQKADSFRNFYKGDSHYYKNTFNMFDLLKKRDVVLLTTEKSLIMPLFKNNEDYKDIIDCTHKLDAENVKYIITNSTSSKLIKGKDNERMRDFLIKELRYKYQDIDFVISDNSKEADMSHIKVRGSNNYSNINNLVIGAYPSPIEEYLYYLSCKEYFDNEFKKSNLIQKEIQKLFLESKISQSVGRNSGFRDNGKKCYVALPLLAPNSEKNIKIKNFEISYISSNVEYIKYDFENKDSKKEINYLDKK